MIGDCCVHQLKQTFRRYINPGWSSALCSLKKFPPALHHSVCHTFMSHPSQTSNSKVCVCVCLDFTPVPTHLPLCRLRSVLHHLTAFLPFMHTEEENGSRTSSYRRRLHVCSAASAHRLMCSRAHVCRSVCSCLCVCV